jgi:hypothetical protein
VIPNGATLGTTNAIQSTIIEVLINNAGTLERAVVNLAGGNDLSETGLISTIAIDAGSDLANVFYSTTARTSVAYRVVRSITSTQATAGNWVTTPSLVQGAGGNALTSMSSLGYGQTWQDVTGSRALGTTYYNTTSKPIVVILSGNNSAGSVGLTINGVALPTQTVGGGVGFQLSASAVIPSGSSYLAITGTSLIKWVELR